MDSVRQALEKLSTAEEFLDFLGVEYDQRVVNVSRLHILKRFNQYLAQHTFSGATGAVLRMEYKVLLERAYQDFVNSDAATEKVFKVFRDAAGVKTFSVERLMQSLDVSR